MPVGTQATVKACTIDDIKTGSEIILSNTYHLMIRPGVERIKSAGGIHEFMNCDLPILTDSGGFQVMSLSKLNKIDREKGAIFNSHIDGKKFYLSPEEALDTTCLNSDIVMIMMSALKKHMIMNLLKNLWIFLFIGPRDQKKHLVTIHIRLYLALFRVDYLKI